MRVAAVTHNFFGKMIKKQGLNDKVETCKGGCSLSFFRGLESCFRVSSTDAVWKSYLQSSRNADSNPPFAREAKKRGKIPQIIMILFRGFFLSLFFPFLNYAYSPSQPEKSEHMCVRFRFLSFAMR